MVGILLLAAVLATGAQGQQCSCIAVDNIWSENYHAAFTVAAPSSFDDGVTIYLTFSHDVDTLQEWAGDIISHDARHYTLAKTGFSGSAGDDISFEFMVHYTGPEPVIVEATLNGEDVCGTGGWTTPAPYENSCMPTGMTPYDYSQVLCMSFLFYEAQRSGPLPADQRVTWRGDSALDDGSDVGHDLTGGYFDAGDHVKFGFPLAYTATVLSWGVLEYKEGYVKAGQLEYAHAAIRWVTDYLLKAHTSPFELYGQVGDGEADHAFWGRPEDMTMDRPAFKIDGDNGGSDLAGETAATLAAAYLVFKDSDPNYADEMLAAAREIYEFADQVREMYHISIPEAANFYKSWSGYGDELTWASLWLFYATGESIYLEDAKRHWDEFGMGEGSATGFSWDDKSAGAYVLMSQLGGASEYLDVLGSFMDRIINDSPYTPDGMVYLDPWGSLRHANNVAFIALRAADLGLNPEVNREFAKSQLDFTLGSSGRSFVVGYGVDPPQRPHHRASSCPDRPSECSDGWAFNNPGPNPQVLYGALVGGPDQDGNYEDDRGDYQKNEVACDYNAAFTGVLAAVTQMSTQ